MLRPWHHHLQVFFPFSNLSFFMKILLWLKLISTTLFSLVSLISLILEELHAEGKWTWIAAIFCDCFVYDHLMAGRISVEVPSPDLLTPCSTFATFIFLNCSARKSSYPGLASFLTGVFFFGEAPVDFTFAEDLVGVFFGVAAGIFGGGSGDSGAGCSFGSSGCSSGSWLVSSWMSSSISSKLSSSLSSKSNAPSSPSSSSSSVETKACSVKLNAPCRAFFTPSLLTESVSVSSKMKTEDVCVYNGEQLWVVN